MKKDDIVRHIRGLKPGQKVESPGLSPTHAGSTFSADCIRVTGSRNYVDRVLSHLKDVILGMETETTELKLVYTQTRDKSGALTDKWNFYAMPVARARNRDLELVQLMRRATAIVAETNPSAAKELEKGLLHFQNN